MGEAHSGRASGVARVVRGPARLLVYADDALCQEARHSHGVLALSDCYSPSSCTSSAAWSSAASVTGESSAVAPQPVGQRGALGVGQARFGVGQQVAAQGHLAFQHRVIGGHFQERLVVQVAEDVAGAEAVADERAGAQPQYDVRFGVQSLSPDRL